MSEKWTLPTSGAAFAPSDSPLMCKVYLTAAVRYLEGDAGRTSVELIKGIWVASDDPDVLEEVRSVAHLYFPNISNGSIAMVSDKLLREEGVAHRPTFANAQVGHAYDIASWCRTYLSSALLRGTTAADRLRYGTSLDLEIYKLVSILNFRDFDVDVVVYGQISCVRL